MSVDGKSPAGREGCAQCAGGGGTTLALLCYQLKACPFAQEKPAYSECPARRAEVGCWEIDWQAFYRQLADGPGKDEWRQAMLDACATCEICAQHRDEMVRRLQHLRDA